VTSAAAASPRARSTTIEPTITIAIPVYNREHLVKKALESALRQPERDLEVLVVDNASTDGTWEVLSSFPDPRLRLVGNDRNLGLFGNFNRCIFLARGRYVVTLCSDDMLLDGFLAPARRLLDTHPEVGLVSSRGRGLNERRGTTSALGSNLPAGIYAKRDAIAATLWALATYYVNPFNYPSGILMRTGLARECGGMDESLGFSADVKLYLKMLETSSLAILDVLGCEVLMHSQQEGEKIFDDLSHIREYADHFTRYASLLEQSGLGRYARAHVGGFLLGSYAKLRRMGRHGVADDCMALFRERRQALAPALRGLMDSLRRRGALRRTGRLTSPVPVAPLPAIAHLTTLGRA